MHIIREIGSDFFKLRNLGSLLLILSFFTAEAQQKPDVLKHGADLQITELKTLNSEQRETNLSVTPDGRFLFFMTDRGGQPWSRVSGTYKGKKRYDGDIWFSEYYNGEWQSPKPLGENVNSASGEDEPLVSQDGQGVVFQSWKGGWQQSGGPYYKAELHGKTWGQAKGLGSGITKYIYSEYRKNSGYATDGMSISPDEQLFLLAAGADYDKPMDLLVSRKIGNDWSLLQKHELSTSGDERSVFIAADGRTVYFASDGYKGGFGGLDIYKAVLDERGKVLSINNLGEPFNTKEDDYGFVLTASGREAFFIREGNVFHADLRNADPNIRPMPTAVISGVIISACDSQYVESEIIIMSEDGKKEITIARSNIQDGKYSLIIPVLDRNYLQIISSKGHTTLQTGIELKGVTQYTEIRADFEMPCEEEIPPNPKLPEKREHFVYFDFDSSEMTSEEQKKLTEWTESLKAFPELRLLLTGHTDSRGADLYNIRLSNHRLRAVKEFLKSIVPGFEITEFEALGESRPAADNSDDKGRKLNRRVEIKAVFRDQKK